MDTSGFPPTPTYEFTFTIITPKPSFVFINISTIKLPQLDFIVICVFGCMIKCQCMAKKKANYMIKIMFLVISCKIGGYVRIEERLDIYFKWSKYNPAISCPKTYCPALSSICFQLQKMIDMAIMAKGYVGWERKLSTCYRKSVILDYHC